jgi:hypothetical protein
MNLAFFKIAIMFKQLFVRSCEEQKEQSLAKPFTVLVLL